jgi:hypothetical protein
MPISAAAIDRRRALAGAIALCATGCSRGAGAEETVLLRLGARPGEVSIINAGTVPVRLRSKIIVEYESDSGWLEALTEMYLGAQCDAKAAVDSVTIPAGQTLQPLPWEGFSCGCHRSCRANVYWGDGPFRFRLTGCDGTSFVSEAFRMPRDPAALWR